VDNFESPSGRNVVYRLRAWPTDAQRKAGTASLSRPTYKSSDGRYLNVVTAVITEHLFNSTDPTNNGKTKSNVTPGDSGGFQGNLEYNDILGVSGILGGTLQGTNRMQRYFDVNANLSDSSTVNLGHVKTYDSVTIHDSDYIVVNATSKTSFLNQDDTSDSTPRKRAIPFIYP